MLTIVASGCPHPTSFEGEPKFPDGVSGCRAACTRDGLEMIGFVYSGEYSTSCVCAPPHSSTGAPGAADGGPTAGVIVQVQAAAAAAAAQQQQLQMQRLQNQSHH